jgi:hypothetical protein
VAKIDWKKVKIYSAKFEAISCKQKPSALIYSTSMSRTKQMNQNLVKVEETKSESPKRRRTP